MGKKSKRQSAQSAAQKAATGAVINSKAVCRIVEEIWAKTQGPAPQTIAAQWQEYEVLTVLVRALREKQGLSTEQLPERSLGMGPFQDWLEEHGVDLNKVEVAEYPEVEYGLRAKKDLQVREKVIVVPEKLMMSSETARQDQLGAMVVRDRMLQAMSNVALAIHLLNETYSHESFWKPYIDILPHSYTTPLYFSKQELQMLQASPCLSEALQQIRSISKLYAHLHKVIRAHNDATLPLYSVGFFYDDFVWAVSTVMSRQNEIPIAAGKKPALALIPLWDMSNHTNGLIGTDFNFETRSCECFATQSFKAGSEFRIFYGPRTNAELFVHQGFVFPRNECDSLRIKLGLSSAEEAATKLLKTQVLQRVGLPISGVFHLLAAESPFSPQLRAFVRVFTAEPSELQRLLSLGDAELREILTSLKWWPGDLRALDFLDKRCKLLLQPYKTSYQEDERLLKEGQLSECACQAVQLRACEKRILQYASQYSQQAKWMLENQVIRRAHSKEATEKGDSNSVEGKEGQNGLKEVEHHSTGVAAALDRPQDSVASPEEEPGEQNGTSSEDSGQGQSGASLDDSGEGEGPGGEEEEGCSEAPVLTDEGSLHQASHEQ